MGYSTKILSLNRIVLVLALFRRKKKNTSKEYLEGFPEMEGRSAFLLSCRNENLFSRENSDTDYFEVIYQYIVVSV